nr:unnamed protein product [Callosobruchus chinensis]
MYHYQQQQSQKSIYRGISKLMSNFASLARLTMLESFTTNLAASSRLSTGRIFRPEAAISTFASSTEILVTIRWPYKPVVTRLHEHQVCIAYILIFQYKIQALAEYEKLEHQVEINDKYYKGMDLIQTVQHLHASLQKYQMDI